MDAFSVPVPICSPGVLTRVTTSLLLELSHLPHDSQLLAVVGNFCHRQASIPLPSP